MNSNTLLSLPDSTKVTWEDKCFPSYLIFELSPEIDEFFELCAKMHDFDCSIDALVTEILEYIQIAESASEGIIALANDLSECYGENDGPIMKDAVELLGNAILKQFKHISLYTDDGILPPYELASWLNSDTMCLRNKAKIIVKQGEVE